MLYLESTTDHFKAFRKFRNKINNPENRKKKVK